MELPTTLNIHKENLQAFTTADFSKLYCLDLIIRKIQFTNPAGIPGTITPLLHL
jgi:hypothetical protein